MSLLSSTAALSIACGGFLWYDHLSERELVSKHLLANSKILAFNSASALIFNDATAATENLRALSVQPNIISATIITKSGKTFASYYRDLALGPIEKPPVVDPSKLLIKFGEGTVSIFNPIIFGKDVLGTLHLESDLRELAERRQRYIGIALVVIFLSFLVAIFVTSKLEQIISRPILHLAETARTVSRDKNYSVRAVAEGRDELGTLITTFNEMLSEIEAQRSDLQTARDELERRVQERTAELESFSYTVSHDLRAPLRAIDGFSRMTLAQYGASLDAEGKRLLGVVITNTRQMGQLIDSLLAFSRLSRKGMQIELLDMQALAVAVAEELKVLELPRIVPIHFNDLHAAWGDRQLIRQVWANLIANALKFSRTRPAPTIEIGSHLQQDHTVYYVKDNGVGFDMAYADKLFGVFQRLHAYDEFEGTGIGLANVQRIVVRHGGRVWAESAVDQGATFYFTLPKVHV